jgi:hypothetical protein
VFVCVRNKTPRSSKRKSKRTGTSGRDSIGSRDTGISVNPNGIDTKGLCRHRKDNNYHQQTAVDSTNPAVGNDLRKGTVEVPDSANRSVSETVPVNHSPHGAASFEKTSAWLRQQTSEPSVGSDTVELDRLTASAADVATRTHATLTESRSEPSLTTDFAPKSSAGSLDIARSSVTVVGLSEMSEKVVSRRASCRTLETNSRGSVETNGDSPCIYYYQLVLVRLIESKSRFFRKIRKNKN